MTTETQALVNAAAVKLAEAADAVREAFAAWQTDFDAGRVTGHFHFNEWFPLPVNPSHPSATAEELRRLVHVGFVTPGVIPGI